METRKYVGHFIDWTYSVLYILSIIGYSQLLFGRMLADGDYKHTNIAVAYLVCTVFIFMFSIPMPAVLILNWRTIKVKSVNQFFRGYRLVVIMKFILCLLALVSICCLAIFFLIAKIRGW